MVQSDNKSTSSVGVFCSDLTKDFDRGLLQRYKNSMASLLSAMYPNHNWLPWKWDRCPKKFWDDVNNKKKFLDWAGKQLGINEPKDWSKVTHKVSKEKNS